MMAPLPSEDVTPGMEEQIKELLESYRPVRQRTVRSETTKIKLGPWHQLSTLFNPPATCLKRDFDSLKKKVYHQRMQYHDALLAYNLWTKGMVFEDHREVQN